MACPDMRVVVDALAARFGGTAVAAAEVAKRLPAHLGGLDTLIVCRSGSLVARGAGGGSGPQILELAERKRLELADRLLWQATSLPRLAQPGQSALLTWSGILPRHPNRVAVVSHLSNPTAFE